MKKLNERTDAEVESNWTGTWKEILQREDGSIDIEQLKKELMDYSDMINRMASLTCQLTGGRLSYPTYPISTVMFVKEEVDEENRNQQQIDDMETGHCSLCGHEFDEYEIAERSQKDSIKNQN